MSKEGMKVIKEVAEVSGEGLESLLGEKVILFCMNYNYSGVLVGVNCTCVKLKDAAIVFETGEFSAKSWKDAQRIGNEFHYVQTSSIESFGLGK